MPISQAVFAQFMRLIERCGFDRCVERYYGNKRVKEFGYYN